jgi:hypothetical protein
MKINFVPSLLALTGFLSLVSPALADTPIATQIVQVANTPAMLTRCLMNDGYAYFSSLNVFNRTTHALLDYSVEYRFFDRDQTLIGNATYIYTPGQELDPGDTAAYNNNFVGITLSEPQSAVTLVTCKLVKADFSGRIQWTPNTQWTGGPLQRPPRATSSTGTQPERDTLVPGGGFGEISHLRNVSGVTLSVVNAWKDAASDGVFVHDTIILHGGSAAATVRAENLALQVTLASGGQQTIHAMMQAAPSYLKFNGMTNSNQYVPQVDPTTDFGRIGSVIVPAGGDITVTATFAVPGGLADSGAIRAVSLR